MLILKVDKFEKFAAGGNEFHTINNLVNEKLPATICASKFKQFILVTSWISGTVKLEKSENLTLY